MPTCDYPLGYTMIRLDTVPLILPLSCSFHVFEILLEIRIAAFRQNACFLALSK